MRTLDTKVSPSFTLDLSMIKCAVEGLRDVVDQKTTVAYAVKVNPHPAVLTILKDLGVSVEVANLRELNQALSVGFPGPRIIVNGPVKLPDLLAKAVGCGTVVHLESMRQVEDLIKIATCLPIPAVGLRIRVPTVPESRFGITIADLPQAVARLHAARIRILGLHVHRTHGLRDATMKDWELRAATLNAGVETLIEAKNDLEYLDWGGGLVPPNIDNPAREDFRAAAADSMTYVHEQTLSLSKVAGRANLRVVIEPGRFLLEHASSLRTTCLDELSFAGRRTVVLDAGIGLLADPNCWIGCYHSEGDGKSTDTCFVGPSCMEEDLLPVRPTLGKVKVGSQVVLCRVGAYHFAGADTFYHDPPFVQVFSVAAADSTAPISVIGSG